MVRGILIGLAIVVANNIQAQQEDYTKRGMISSYGTISLGTMLNRDEVNSYFSGGLAVRLDDNYSLFGATHLFVDGNQQDLAYLKEGMRNFIGIQRHFSFGNFDLHLDFLPGFSFLTLNDAVGENNSMQIVPSIGAAFGVRYYVWKFFNFFATATHVNSSIDNVPSTRGKADELLFTGGLGFNIQAFNRK